MKHKISISAVLMIAVSWLVISGFASPCLKATTMEVLRTDTLAYLRKVSTSLQIHTTAPYLPTIDITGGWTVSLILYDNGRECATGLGENDHLGAALLTAAKNILYTGDGEMRLTKEEMDRARFHVTITPSRGKAISFIEYNGKACELAGDVVAVRAITKDRIASQITAGREYLLRMMNAEQHAFFKRYDALIGVGEDRLRTIYTASSLYTFLKMQKIGDDDRINDAIDPITAFLLSMQVTEGKQKGAFYYSLFLDSQQKENRFVVGTASKTIFTLLVLYQTMNDERYLAAAQAAGDWLLSMQREDGTVLPYVTLREGTWRYGKKFSCLYNGQVLSALSRLYGVTHDQRYFEGAEKIAQILSEKARHDHYFLNDEYRLSNDPIPTSWVVMSLLDYYKVSQDKKIRKVLRRTMRELLSRQKKDRRDILNYGRFDGTLATSGNGWINEVLGELYTYGRAEGWHGGGKYRKAMILVSRWLIQNTYSPENTYFLENPEKAYGGLIRNQTEEAVRTDAVCHGVNGYIMLHNTLPDDFCLRVPESNFPRSAKGR